MVVGRFDFLGMGSGVVMLLLCWVGVWVWFWFLGCWVRLGVGGGVGG